MKIQESDIRFFNLSKDKSHIKYTDLNRKLSIPLDEETKRTRVKQLINTFIQIGWRKDWIEAKLTNLCDEDIASLPHEDIIYGLSCIWLVQSNIDSSQFKEAYYSIGLYPSTIRKITWMLDPLIDTSYCNIQLLDIGLEWIISCNSAHMVDP
jgi:hypothetical protein